MKTKEIEVNGKKITIWKMNMGFLTDYKGDISELVYKKDKTGKIVREVTINNGKMELYSYVYGIYKSDDLGIKPISNIELGLTPEEKIERIKLLRTLNEDLTEVYKELQEFNTEADEEVLKK